jgi:intracellular multiplication protein IcmO
MIPRQIVGPQEKFERSGAQSLRDIRPLTTRFSEALAAQVSGFVLAAAAGLVVLMPGTVDLLVPASCCYALWVLTRRVKLPLRLPQSAGCRDWNYPDPATRRPRKAAGSIYLGRDQTTGQELWITSDDGRQHGTIPGTTGAGKTTAILSFVANALSHGSGFVLVDGKADNKLFGEVLALARRFGREDDVLALNFLVASGARDSNTFNPFASGNADAIRELLASQLGEQRAEDPNGVFRSRAIALVGTMAPVLVWMRDHKGIPINIEKIRFSLELRSIWMLATLRVFIVRDAVTGRFEEILVPDMPEDLVYPLQAYLGEIPGYDTELPYNKQKTDEPFKQHGFALFYFTQTFTQLAVSLGHIFKCESGDVDMRDVVLNRRILVVNLPALENSDDTLAALGKIVVASLRGMMAQLLGARLEGDYAEIVAHKPGMGPAPFQVVLDELAYYATSGLDRMLAMGRGLNIMFWLSFQEVSGIWARIGEKTNSLLGNANITVAMRQQDAERTRRWLQGTAGQTFVTQATSYHGSGMGNYREAQQAEVRATSRVDWNDLQRLIEGEAIILLGGRRIYAKLFYAKVNTDGPMRLNRALMLAAPDIDAIRAEVRRLDGLVEAIENGAVAGPDHGDSPVLRGLVGGFAAAVAAGASAEAAVAAGIKAVGELPQAPIPSAPAANDPAEPPVCDLTPMLAAGGAGKQPEPGGRLMAVGRIDEGLVSALAELEKCGGASEQTARANALAAMAARDSGMAATGGTEPDAMSPEALTELIEQIIDDVEAIGSGCVSAAALQC